VEHNSKSLCDVNTNFIRRFILLRRIAVRKNDNSLLFLSYCPLFFILFVRSLSQKCSTSKVDRSHWGVQHTRMITYPALFFQLLSFVIFSHQYSHRFQICNHFSHQFSLPKNLLKLNYSALLQIHSSNEQTHPAGDGHVDMALVTFRLEYTLKEKWSKACGLMEKMSL
jgi:hypothetical protein